MAEAQRISYAQFHLLREYRRNIGELGWDEAKELPMSEDLTAARKLAAQIVKLTGNRGADLVQEGAG